MTGTGTAERIASAMLESGSEEQSMGGGIEKSVAKVLSDGRWLSYDLGGTARCSEVGQAIREALAS